MGLKRLGLILLLPALACGLASSAAAQPRQNLRLAQVAYNTLKATTRPQGELKEKIDTIDNAIREASRLGRTGEVRRLLARGVALLSGREWTDLLDFNYSLILRSGSVFVDSSKSFSVTLEQIYTPILELSASLTARAALHTPRRGPRGAQVGGEKVKELGSWDAVSRDLQDDPLQMEVDLEGVEDGPYVLQVELFETDKSLGSTSLAVDLHKGLDARLARIAAEAKALPVPDSAKADVLYPLDIILNVNRGRIGVGTFEIGKELELAEGYLTELKAGKDPFSGRTGDMERHYLMEGAQEIMPFRVHVPGSYTGQQPLPLIIALHGLGANEDSFFDSYGKQFPKLAEERGYLVAAPLGFRVDGGYGMNYLRSSDDLALTRKLEYSEKDVMNVLTLMKKYYKVDEKRIYLTGHSMGAIGTWYLGAKYPEIWASLGAFAGVGSPDSVGKMKHIPQFVVHGDADYTVPVNGSRLMVAAMKRLEVEHQYIEVPGGNHIDVVMPNFKALFDFFDGHKK